MLELFRFVCFYDCSLDDDLMKKLELLKLSSFLGLGFWSNILLCKVCEVIVSFKLSLLISTGFSLKISYFLSLSSETKSATKMCCFFAMLLWAICFVIGISDFFSYPSELSIVLLFSLLSAFLRELFTDFTLMTPARSEPSLFYFTGGVGLITSFTPCLFLKVPSISW